MATKKRSVGLVVLTEVPGMGVVALLRRRGKYNYEKEKEGFRESCPGSCQVTCHGKVKSWDEDGDLIIDRELGPDDHMETDPEALFRELKEELGKTAGTDILKSTPDGGDPIVLMDDVESNAVTFGVFYPPKNLAWLLQVIKLESSTGGLEFLPQSEVDNIRNLRDFDKDTGVTDLNIIAMFRDEIEAVRRAFEKLVPQAPTS